MSRPVEPSKSRVPVEPSRSRVLGRWPRHAVASRSRVTEERSWLSGHVSNDYNTILLSGNTQSDVQSPPKVQPIRKPPPEIDKTIHNPKKARGTRFQTTPRKGVLDIGYWRYPYPGHGKCLAPFRHGRRAIRKKTTDEELSPCDQRQ